MASQPPARGRDPRVPRASGWEAVGLRRTPQREIVLEIIRSCSAHPTAEWIHQQCRRRIPDISLATVYRTLRVLKERGLVHEFSAGSSPSRFDGMPQDHEHVRCVRCGTVTDIDLPEVRDLRERVAERTGFVVGSYPLLFHGMCSACASDGPRDGCGCGPQPPSNGGEPHTDEDRQRAEGYW